MIRQAISCDVCGAEKKQTNHWFVAAEMNGELRMGGWNSRMCGKPGAKHLCGQTCLHKLVDEFMARTIGGRVTPAPSEPVADTSLTSVAAHHEIESSARVLRPVVPEEPLPAAIAAPVVVRANVETAAPFAMPPQREEAPNYASRRWRAEAWERERNREKREGGRRSEIVHRRSGS